MTSGGSGAKLGGMLELIRASALQGFPKLVAELGGDPGELLRDCGVAPEVVGNPDAYITYRALAAVLEHAASRLERPDFGLELSRNQGIEILGPIALFARHAATVGDAFDGVARYLHVYSPAIRIGVEPVGRDGARFTFTVLAGGIPARAQVEELSLGVALFAVRLLGGRGFRPRFVAVPHAPMSRPARYREFFDADVRFERGWCGFEFDRAYLTRHLAGDDALVRDLATRYLAAASSPAGGVTGTVAALVDRTLATGHCSVAGIAAELGVHPRTLQRHLSREGTSFHEIVDAARRDRSLHYLTATELPLGQVSALLGYSEQSAFSRACRGWCGEPPRAVRRRARDPGGR